MKENKGNVAPRITELDKTIGQNVKALRIKHGLNQDDLADGLGISKSLISLLETGQRAWNSTTITAVVNFFKTDASIITGSGEEIRTVSPNYIQVIGDVQAGVWKEAEQWDDADTYTIPCIVDAKYASKAYGLRIIGDSMNMIYPEGTVVIVVPIWEYDGEISSGKRVIVERCKKDGICEATAKQLEIVNGHALLWPKSTNPKFQTPIDIAWPYQSPQDMGLETVEIKGVIIGAYWSEE